jgi:hypothetical protein
VVARENGERGWFGLAIYWIEEDGALVQQWFASDLLTPAQVC